MNRLTPRTASFLVIDVLLVGICLLHASALLSRSRVPFESVSTDTGVLITDMMDHTASRSLRPGDIITRFDNHDVPSPEALEFLADYHPIGSDVTITYLREGTPGTTQLTTIPYYGIGYVVMVFLIGVCSWIVGIYVLLMKQEQLEATVLHWGMMSLGAVVVLAWEGITPDQPLPYASSVLFFVAYIGVTATFLFFTFLFPARTQGSIRIRAGATYLLAGLSLAPVLYYHSRALFLVSVADYETFQTWFDVFHVVVFLFIAGAIFNFIVSFVRADSSEDRRKIQWLAFGFCTGPTPFILLTVVPSLLSAEWAIDEQYTLGFLIIVPVTFAISFVRHHLFDVEVVIQRTTAYGLVVAALLLVYVLSVAMFAGMIGSYASETYALSAVLVGLLFEPVRRRVRLAVDRTFFRIRYNFREAARSFGEELRQCLDTRNIGELLATKTDSVIPLERIGVFARLQPGLPLQTIAGKGFDAGELPPLPDMSGHHSPVPTGISTRLEPGIDHFPADEELFTQAGITMVLPLISQDLGPLGFVALGPKKSGRRFTLEDVDLLRSFTSQSALTMERIILQHRLILKQQEAEHLAKLSEMKSDFVSNVSHELKTPLTSIKLFAELLGETEHGLDERGRDFLKTIEGETDRLDRMVSTILNSAEIEHGVKEFRKQRVDLVRIAADSIRTMEYQLSNAAFEVDVSMPDRAVFILADRDAVYQCLLNLIANAIKYSGENRYLRICVCRREHETTCAVEDRGIGIPPQAQEHLFTRYYRGTARRSERKGVGLGLALVKHIMNAHGGRVDLRSEPGSGSTFTLCFPTDAGATQ